MTPIRCQDILLGTEGDQRGTRYNPFFQGVLRNAVENPKQKKHPLIEMSQIGFLRRNLETGN